MSLNQPPKTATASTITETRREAPDVDTAPAVRTELDRERASAARRERLAVAGGMRLKLSVIGSIKDYHLYWANDEGSEIPALLREGFSYVTQEELNAETSHVIADAEITDRISRYVGQKEDGSPLRAFLLKVPEDIWQEFDAARHQQADEWEGDILRNRKTELEDEERYTPRGYKSSIKQETR